MGCLIQEQISFLDFKQKLFGCKDLKRSSQAQLILIDQPDRCIFIALEKETNILWSIEEVNVIVNACYWRNNYAY